MGGLVLIFACLVLGKALARHAPSPNDFIKSINVIVIRLALPALVLDKLHALTVTSDALLPILSPWMIFAFTALLLYLLKFIIPMSRATLGCLILLCSTSNTSFVGLPLLNAFIGEQAIGMGVLIDQSNFVALFTVGLIIANIYSGQSVNIIALARNLLKYPPVVALILAIMLKPFTYPEFFQYLLTTFGNLLTPLTMLAVGAGLKLPKDHSLFKYMGVGLLIKLMIAPLMIFFIARLFFQGTSQLTFEVVVLQAAMAPMVTAAIIAIDKNLSPELANLLTGFGIPLSFATVALWHLVTTL